MSPGQDQPLVLRSRHTGETLTIRRVRNGDGIEDLQLDGSLPPRRQGPPLHVHHLEDEHGEVVAGAVSAVVDGKKIVVAAGGKALFPRGSAHRWWNDGDAELVFRGVVTPAADLDRYLHAVFEVLNAGPPERPPLFYLAHVLHRHRLTQTLLVPPPAVQRVLWPAVIALGTLLGKYRGTSWPGCPVRCTGAPPSASGG